MIKYRFSNIEKDLIITNSEIKNVKIEEYYNEVNEQLKTNKIITYTSDNAIIFYFIFLQKEYIIEKKNINHISLFELNKSLIIILYNEELKNLYQIQIDTDEYGYLLFNEKIIIDNVIIRNNLKKNFINEKKNIDFINNRLMLISKELSFKSTLVYIIIFLYLIYNIYKYIFLQNI